MMTERLFEFALLALVLSSVWIALVLALHPWVTPRLGARWAYALWWVPLLGLLALLVPTHGLKLVLDLPTLSLPEVQPNLLATVWLAGAVLSLLALVLESARASRRTRRLSRALTGGERDRLHERLAALARRFEVEIRMLTVPHGPAVTGLVRPVLCLPSDFFDRFSAAQQTLVLAHELHHIRRRDVLFQLLARIHRCLFWFNPLAWMAERRMALDQELSCDDFVLREENLATRRRYGEALLLAAHAAPAGAQAGYASIDHIRQRLSMLRQHRPALAGNVLGMTLLALAAVPSLACGLLGGLGADGPVREELRAPLAGMMDSLRCDELDEARLRELLTHLQLLPHTHGNPPFNRNEQATVRGLRALTYQRLGDSRASLAELQAAATLARGALHDPLVSVCDALDVRLADGDDILKVDT